MDKMLVAVYKGEADAYEGARMLKELHDEGSITLYGEAVVVKDAKGVVRLQQAADQGPLGTAVGLLAGSLIGLAAGPAGVAAGASVGGLGGISYDLANVGVGIDFVEEVSDLLEPGNAAVIAEVEEDWETPVDTRLEATGGRVFRRPRGEVVHAYIERDVRSFTAELAQLNAEYYRLQEKNDVAQRSAAAKLKQKVDATDAKLKDAQARAKTSLEQAKREADSKVQSLHKQAAKARDERKQRIEKREEEVQATLRERIAKLERAWELTEEAMAP